MSELIVDADVEAWAVGYLSTALALRPEGYASGVYVSKVLSNPRVDRMVTVRDDGGPELDVVRTSHIVGVNVWAATDEDATDLARLVAALLKVSPDGAPVVKAFRLSGPLDVADDTGQPHRYLVFELTVRGSPA